MTLSARAWLVLAPAIALLALATPAYAQTGSNDSTFRDHRRAARRALDAGNYSALREQLLVLYDQLSGRPDVVYGLAGTEAHLGNADGALRWLRTYAAMGMVHDVGDDSDFVPLRSLPPFDSVLRQVDRNRRPIASSTIAMRLPASGLITEDIAYDPETNLFFVSSVREGKVLAIDERGVARDFIRSGQDGLWSIFALAVDVNRHVLWLTTAAVPQNRRYQPADSGRTAVVQYDIRTGRRLARADLRRDGHNHVLGDMTLGTGGEAYISDGIGGGVYLVRPGGRVLEALVNPGVLGSPQTPALGSDGRRLYVADYIRGIAMVDLTTRLVHWLPHPPECAVSGIDGLSFTGHSLLAVQNGTDPARLLRIDLETAGDRASRCTVLEQSTPGLGEPTHGIVVGTDYFYIVNAGWARFTDAGVLRPDAPPDAPAIWRIPLPRD